MKAKLFKEYPQIELALREMAERYGFNAGEMKDLLELVSEVSFKNGFIEGIKTIVKELLNSHVPIWAPVLITALLAARVSSWPYGVLMSLKAIF